MALYDVLHDTTYRYDSAVLLSQQIAHLRPRERAGQHTLAHRLEIAPAPAQRSERSDFFGNPVTAFALLRFLGRGVARTASRIADLRAGEPKGPSNPRHFVSVDQVARRRRTVSGA